MLPSHLRVRHARRIARRHFPIVVAIVAMIVAWRFITSPDRSRIEPDTLATTTGATAGDQSPEWEAMEGDRRYLSDLPWSQASTGWVAIANEDLPALDRSFRGGLLTIGGATYEKGIGVYPRSEISYQLDGRYATFESDIGLNDLPTLPTDVEDDSLAGVVFAVYLDGALAYDSGAVRHGQLAVPVSLPIAGVRELRLVVTAAGPPSPDNLANWADARLLRPDRPFTQEAIEANLGPLRQQVEDRLRGKAEDRLALEALDLDEAALVPLLPRVTPQAPKTLVVPHPSRQALVLWNGVLAVTYGLGGEDHGQLTVFYAPDNHLTLYRADASILLSPDLRLSLHHDTIPALESSHVVKEVADPIFGNGTRLDVFLRSRDGRVAVAVSLTLYDASAYFVQQIEVTGAPASPRDATIRHVEWLGPSNLALGDGLRYLTDVTRLRSGNVTDDGLRRRETADQGKPLLLTSESSGLGLLLAPLDETTAPTDILLQVDAGRVMGRLGFVTGAARDLARPAAPVLRGPRLYVEVTNSVQPQIAFRNFRRIAAALYPPLPLPEWVRYQWLSWYVYGMDIGEASIRRQIDYIAENLADLGPWHIIVDAGWYVAEGRPGASWRNVDRDKFPSGLRALVDYAHGRNVRVVLYFSAPYLDSRIQSGDWLGLRDIIQNHPEWLVLLGGDDTHQSLAYDFENPDLRSYMADVMRDYFVTYDVDGIKIDGLGNAEGAILTPNERDAFGLASRLLQSTLDIYRFVHDQATSLKSDVYIESGWQDPLFANPLAHTFRYGDEGMAFTRRYPFPGLVEHVDYAIAQQSLFGQRANMGAVYAHPDEGKINEQWLAAALALGAQAVLSFDLPVMSNAQLSRYRALLAPYRPFAGTTYYRHSAGVDSFATVVDGTTFLGVLNRSPEAREVDLPLADYGLNTGVPVGVFDVESERLLSAAGSLRAKVEPRSLRLFVLRDSAGVLWTNSSSSIASPAPDRLNVVVRGPARLDGLLHLYLPGLKSLAVDGRQLFPGGVLEGGLNPGTSFSYDRVTGVATLRYRHDQPHRVEVSVLTGTMVESGWSLP